MKQHQDPGRPPRTPPAPRRQPQTRSAQGERQQPAAPLPHERDESAHDTQGADAPSMGEIGRLAHADAARGAPDTSRSVQADETYHRLREGTPGGDGRK